MPSLRPAAWPPPNPNRRGRSMTTTQRSHPRRPTALGRPLRTTVAALAAQRPRPRRRCLGEPRSHRQRLLRRERQRRRRRDPLQRNLHRHRQRRLGRHGDAQPHHRHGNVATGASALSPTPAATSTSPPAPALPNTSGSGNVATGCFALFANTTGDDNVATGTEALDANTTGELNVATGTPRSAPTPPATPTSRRAPGR